MIERTSCPITKNDSTVIFSRPYRLPALQSMIGREEFIAALHDKAFEVRYCADSDLYFQRWVLDDSELSRWYKMCIRASSFREEIANQKLHWFAHQTEEILVFRQLCKIKFPTVLDYGCSWGKWASMALAHGCDAFGFDVDEEAVKFCSQKGIRMLSKDEIEEHRFDFINCDQVLEHVRDPLELMQLFSRVLKPGAIVKVSTPNQGKLPQQLKKGQVSLDAETLDALFPLVHINLFSRNSLVGLGGRVGLKPCKMPLGKWLGAAQLWNIPRQFNRNLRTPFKRWLGQGSYVWLTL